MLNLRKPWTGNIKSNKLHTSVQLLPDTNQEEVPEELVILVVSIKILKNRLPGFKYEAHTAIKLCSGAEVLTEIPEGVHCFKDSKDEINFTMKIASQEAVEKTASSELRLSVEVQLHEILKGDVTFNDDDEDGFTLVDLKKSD